MLKFTLLDKHYIEVHSKIQLKLNPSDLVAMNSCVFMQ